jgi:hypothetical protein
MDFEFALSNPRATSPTSPTCWPSHLPADDPLVDYQPDWRHRCWPTSASTVS